MARHLILLLMSLFAGFAAAGDSPDEFFDETTGASITVVHEPIVLTVEHPALAPHARDYVSLTAVAVDRSGQIRLYLIGYFWSNIDRQDHDRPARIAKKPIKLRAGAEQLQLLPLDPFPRDLMDEKKLLAPRSANFGRAAYAVTPQILRKLSTGKSLTATLASDARDEVEEDGAYELWTGKNSLKPFVERMEANPAITP